MKTKQVSVYLVSAILTLAILPFLASYLLIDEIIDNASSLVVKPQTEQILINYQQDLKALRKLAPEKANIYKSQFNDITDELVIYQQPQLVKKVLRDTYLTYYLVLFIIVLFFSLTAAIFLSRRVANSYRRLVVSDIAKAKKLQELSYFDEWQIITGKLAHEINNPLTPIAMMVSNLSRIYQKADSAVFAENLRNTESVVSEEVAKLKAMVSHFNKFSKLPEPVFIDCNIVRHLSNFIEQYNTAWKVVKFSLCVDKNTKEKEEVNVLLDPILFNQVLINLINNAIQANLEMKVLNIDINVSSNSTNVCLTIFNQGRSIAATVKESIFKMHYSGTQNNVDRQENMGLGLAIVRKIILDHSGDIRCLPIAHGAAFEITLPISSMK